MALTDNSKQWLEGRRELPSIYSEGATVPSRSSKYGEQIVQPLDRQTLVAEGSYYIVTNPTPGTGIAGIAAANGYDATEALMTIRNALSAGDNTKRLFLDYIKLQPTAAGANGTNCTYATHKDKGNTRWSSGGTAYVPVNANLGSANVSLAGVHFGALVTDAATADVVKLGSGNLRTAIVVVGDEILFDFVGDRGPGASSLFEGTLICKQVVKHVPVMLNPEEEFILTVNAASQSGATSFEFECGFWLR